MKQKELAEKYGVTPQMIGKIRKQVCDPEDYDPKTREVSDKGCQKIGEYFHEEDEKIIQPKFVKVQVISEAPNPMFLFCKRLEKPIKKVAVSIPASHIGQLRTHLVFNAQEIEKAGEKFYRHEDLYKRELIRSKAKGV